MKYISTRDTGHGVSGARAIIQGISPEGGLYVPEQFPFISSGELKMMMSQSYPERSAYILSKFLPELGEQLLDACEKAYSRFDGDAAPLVKLDDGLFILELWHGPTYAFKDIALTLLPSLLTLSKKAEGETSDTLVLVATSGDTGKAALEGFKDAPNTAVITLFPTGGVSNLQKLQMVTQEGENVLVASVNGNFDDAQTAVKNAFADGELKKYIEEKGWKFSSANSINFGRLAPQIAYYFSSYIDLMESGQIMAGEPVNFCVPTGNFGNILAAYYAKEMGLPIGKLICASNKNNVLSDFFEKGEYDADREFYKTASPSMDILISSNLERLIFEASGRDAAITKKRMDELKQTGSYSVTEKELAFLSQTFTAGWADEDEAKEALGGFFEEYGYVTDTHTAVALSVYSRYIAETEDATPTVIVSTASPYKFVGSVLTALGESVPDSDKKAIAKLEDVSAMPVPETLTALFSKKVLHSTVIEKDGLSDLVKKFADDMTAKKK